MHLLGKMRLATDGGSRFGIVLNGSPLFAGAAGSGKSEIRRYVLENDLSLYAASLCACHLQSRERNGGAPSDEKLLFLGSPGGSFLGKLRYLLSWPRDLIFVLH
jgi:hypothetical protein